MTQDINLGWPDTAGDTESLLGVSEINISVKTVNRAERFFRLLGYRHVENGLTKTLEVENV